jgi:hypothetical protein
MCRKALHRYREALLALRDWRERYAAIADPSEVAAAEEAIAEMVRLLGTLVVTVEPPGAAIAVDGETVGFAPLSAPVEVEVGRHTVAVALEGYEPWLGEAIVSSGEERAVTVTLVAAVPLEPTPPPVFRPDEPGGADTGVAPAWFWAVAGTAVALGVGGAVTSVMVGVEADEFASNRPACQAGDADACSAGLDAADRHDSYQVSSWVLLPAAVAAAVAAGVLAAYIDWNGETPAAGELAVTAIPTTSSDGSLDGFALGALVRF